MTEQEKHEFEIMQKEYEKKKTFRASLVGKEKRLIDLIERVDCNNKFSMKVSELAFLIRLHNNNLAEGAYDIYRYGYLHGKMAAERQKIE
jgi:hypothetical protein